MNASIVSVIAQVAVTLVLVGLILTVQLVHYPLFARVGAPGFAAYEAEHSARITALVLPLMFSELALASWMAFTTPPGLPRWSAWVGLGLVASIWLSTFCLQVPQHAILGRGWDARAHAALVATNWIRTVAWVARGGLGVWWLFALAAR